MPPVIPDPKAIRAFKTAAAFEVWLAANHDSATELFLKIHKKNSGLATITYAEALDIALCYGRTDGIKKSFDETSFLQRFTPRKSKSIWSATNTQHIERLMKEGRMQTSGLAQVDAAKADGRWANAYSAGRDMTVPDDFVAAVRKNAKANTLFATLNRQNQFAIAFRLGNIKTAATRTKRIGEFVAMLARGETPYPNGKVKAP